MTSQYWPIDGPMSVTLTRLWDSIEATLPVESREQSLCEPTRSRVFVDIAACCVDQRRKIMDCKNCNQIKMIIDTLNTQRAEQRIYVTGVWLLALRRSPISHRVLHYLALLAEGRANKYLEVYFWGDVVINQYVHLHTIMSMTCIDFYIVSIPVSYMLLHTHTLFILSQILSQDSKCDMFWCLLVF